MTLRFPLLTLFTVLVLVASVSGGIFSFYPYGFPFAVNLVDAHTAIIEQLPGMPLPPSIQSGDQIDLSALYVDSRISLLTTGPNKPDGHTYALVIRKGNKFTTVQVKAVDYSNDTVKRFRLIDLWFTWVGVCTFLVLGVISVLTLWRGRERAAKGMALWAITVLVGNATYLLPLDGLLGLSTSLLTNLLYVLARIGFYIMAESILAPSLTPKSRALWRWGFILILTAGAAIVQFGGPILFVTTGWAEMVLPKYGLIFVASYLVPVVMLFLGYRRAEAAHRLRIQWALWGSVAWLMGIFFNDAQPLGNLFSSIVGNFALLLGMCGILYAVLRHRLMDVSVILDHTLVYGGVTALVVGILAAVNTVVQHAAIGTSASLLLQVVVPLALGIVLSRVRLYTEKTVERVFFRKKYQAEKALRSFARRCSHIESTDRLMEATTTAIRQNLGATGVALYERRSDGYLCVRRDGETAYQQQVNSDDDAFVAARGDFKEVDLSELHSTLGTDGYVFPMTAHGTSQGVLVCANRPGEHYAADERKLLAYVAHQVGLALYVLRMQAKLKLVDTLASGSMTSLPEIQAKARELVGSSA